MRPTDLTRRAMLTGLSAAALVPAASLARSGTPSRGSEPPSPPGDAAIPAAPPHGPWPDDDELDPFDPGLFDPFTARVGGVDPSTITIDLPQMRYEGRWNPRAGAMRVLARELRLRTRLEPVLEPALEEPSSLEPLATASAGPVATTSLEPVGAATATPGADRVSAARSDTADIKTARIDRAAIDFFTTWTFQVSHGTPIGAHEVRFALLI